jgi:hypothetical protein
MGQIVKSGTRTPPPDAFLVAQYKKHKLSLKDEIEQLEKALFQ